MDYPKQVDVGRCNLWVKDSKRGDKFLSGVIEFYTGDGELVKVSIRAFKNNKRNERSADFFGSVSVEESNVGCGFDFSEKVEVGERPVEVPKRASASKPSVRRSRVEEVSEIEPIF